MANPLKGEIDINLSGKSYTCRLTIDSIIRIEEELDTSIIELAIKISQAKAKLKELATVLKYALRNGGNDIDGTWGEWTIQEGENDLFLINRRNGKKYSFLLKEID